MGWAFYNHAVIDKVNPRPLGTCDRCGQIWNRDRLKWQYEWEGIKQHNLRVLVCPPCMDHEQEQLRTITIPPDPFPIENPRPGEYSAMTISSAPSPYDTIVPSQLVVQAANPPILGTIGDRSPLVTQGTSLPLLTEITVTPTSTGYLFDSTIHTDFDDLSPVWASSTDTVLDTDG